MWWTPDQFARKRGHLAKRSAITADVRRFFTARAFDEVETPALQLCPGIEPHIKLFATDMVEPFGQGAQTLYLHSSPEFAMKKLLVAGMTRIFQLARVYRNGERSDTHHPEFTMLEWYRVGATYRDLMVDCEDLLRSCLAAAQTDVFVRQGRRCDPSSAWQILSVAEAFRSLADIDVLATVDNPDDPSPDPAALATEARRIGIVCGESDRWEDIFFRIAIELIEPKLGDGVPTILFDYPACMAALARRKPEDPRVAERFELYVCGVELANAYTELIDVVEQRHRFMTDTALRERLYGERLPIDEDFLAALAFGMPASAGIALGFDRLVMLASGAEVIEDVLWVGVAH